MPDDAVVLFVEDDPTVRFGSAQALELAGRTVRVFASAEEALPAVTPGFRGVLVTDVRLPGIDGMALLERAKRIDADLPVIVVTGHGDVSMAVQAMRSGAYDFIEKPFSAERLNVAIGRALETRRLTLEVNSLRTQLSGLESIEAKMIGRSAAMSNLRRVVLDIASTNADVLITGETGTGKELVARCLHDYSKRRSAHFAAINCGGIPETLFESEVFGHEAGSFTGAARRRVGKMEHAAGGTLFLDEIESMPVSLQVTLLRCLQERQFERLGSNELQPMSCRVIAATKSDLLRPNGEQPFRRDLYYRLSVVVLELPPLRERREDIPLLFGHFLLQASARYERPPCTVPDGVMNELMGRAWPGNVRELRNVADRLVLGLPLGESGTNHGTHPQRPLDEQMAMFERHVIEEALSRCGGRAVLASERLGLPKKTLYDKMKRLGISSEEFRGVVASETA
ncbi:MAG TPA: sigma-54 dependent transcriptional regulator [Caldimonas sp.]|jgi:two-component system, NtrC family, C4-dicarboxylate transport response regulator DctD|nr:sigma-54 dependent transcriptional regulator [Caldimonas sp.]